MNRKQKAHRVKKIKNQLNCIIEDTQALKELTSLPDLTRQEASSIFGGSDDSTLNDVGVTCAWIAIVSLTASCGVGLVNYYCYGNSNAKLFSIGKWLTGGMLSASAISCFFFYKDAKRLSEKLAVQKLSDKGASLI